jgi:hypothetical protein
MSDAAPNASQRYCQEIVNQLREPRKIITTPKGYREESLCSMIQYYRLRILLLIPLPRRKKKV